MHILLSYIFFNVIFIYSNVNGKLQESGGSGFWNLRLKAGVSKVLLGQIFINLQLYTLVNFTANLIILHKIRLKQSCNKYNNIK